MLPIFFRPGQQLKRYAIYRKKAITDEKGRVSYIPIHENDDPIGYLVGSLSLSTQEEIKYWKQLGHPVTHKIVVRGKTNALAGDILMRNHEKYYVRGIRDLAETGIFTSIFCGNREGIG